jgi:hypothetical protein
MGKNVEVLEDCKKPCCNLNKKCNENVHNIIYEMININSHSFSNKYLGYISGIGSNNYSPIEGIDCYKYVQELVPRHLPQIECGIEPLLRDFSNNNYKNTINILDIASGLGTVGLAICRILKKYNYNLNINLTMIEPSNTFAEMIKKFKIVNNQPNLKISHWQYKFDQFLSEIKEDNSKYFYDDEIFDWIVMSNFITGITDNNDL